MKTIARARLSSMPLMVVCCLGAISVAFGQTNLLTNPGFEEGADAPTGWTTFPPAPAGFTYSVDDETSHAGERSACIANDADQATGRAFGMWQQVVPVTPGDIYIISSWVRMDGGERGTNACLQLLFRDADDRMLERNDLSGHSGTMPWARDFPHDMRVLAPENAATVEVNLFLEGAGTVWFDDVFFDLGPAGDISGTITAGGEPLEGALVQVWGSPFADTTDAEGRYTLAGVPQASPRYVVIASMDGHRKKAAGDLDVLPGETLTFDLELEAGEDPEALRVKFGSLLRQTRGPRTSASVDGVIDPDLYPDEVKVYLEPSECIDSDHPLVVEVAAAIMEGLAPADRTSTLKVARAAYEWIVQNVEYDVIYSGNQRGGRPGAPRPPASSFVDSTEGKWQTITGEGWCWGHNFTDWLYKTSEALTERRAICIEHGRVAAGLLRALGIPARPIKPYSAQFWVQVPGGESYWSGMGTSGGRNAFRERGSLSAGFRPSAPSSVQLIPIDAGPVVHSDWYTDNKCLWREVHPWRANYEDTDQGVAQAVADLATFAATGDAPPRRTERGAPAHRPATALEIAYADFTLDFSNIGDQEVLHVRFPLPVETEFVDCLDDLAHWTNYPDLITRTWLSEETNPPVAETRVWYNIDFDLTAL